MQHVLIDACGWVACIDAQLNIQRDMEALVGPCTWVLLPGVEAELERLENERTKKKSLLLSLLRSRALRLETEKSGHTDDALVACARENNWATLTVDTALKRRLYEANLPVIEVRQNNHLHVVESL
ncbi:MAG: hypothetical protein CL980_02075 [Euryarchaeota archaeon]|nr:hypothetical protein [Euryarchaeota archaeon]